jgi:hypothetical protein
MLNFRVNDLDAMVAQLNEPEGNPVELWQPA